MATFIAWSTGEEGEGVNSYILMHSNMLRCVEEFSLDCSQSIVLHFWKCHCKGSRLSIATASYVISLIFQTVGLSWSALTLNLSQSKWFNSFLYQLVQILKGRGVGLRT